MVNDEDGGHLATWEIDGSLRMSRLLQYHMHAPSEHTFNGKNMDLEFHFVHQDKDDELSVLGIVFD